MVHSSRLWHHYIILGWFTPPGSDSPFLDSSLHLALTPLYNPGMVHSIRLCLHLYLRWFTPSGFDSTYSWDHSLRLWRHLILGHSSLHRALRSLIPGMVNYSNRLRRHLILEWFTPSGSDATYTWDGSLHPAFTPLPGMVYFIRLWRHLNLGWFTPSGSDATYTWDGSLYPVLTPLTWDGSLHPALTPFPWDGSLHPALTSLTCDGSLHPALTPLIWDGSLHSALAPLIPGIDPIRLWHHSPGVIDPIRLLL